MSSGPGEATLLTTVVSLDPVYAYFDADEQIYPEVHGRRAPRTRGAIERHIQMALANEEGYPREGTARLPRQPARWRHRHDPRTRGVPQRAMAG